MSDRPAVCSRDGQTLLNWELWVQWKIKLSFVKLTAWGLGGGFGLAVKMGAMEDLLTQWL